jgi:hypothetical protein
MLAATNKVKKKKNACRTAKCECAEDDCTHTCCNQRRAHEKYNTLITLTAARACLTPRTPAHKLVTVEMEKYGYERTDAEGDDYSSSDEDEQDEDGRPMDLADEFDKCDELAREDKIGAALERSITQQAEGMRQQQQSQEMENALTRLLASLPTLETANDIEKAMSFFHKIQAEAESETMELAFKAALGRCRISRFNTILRTGERTPAGWKAACITIMKSIDRHFLSSAKKALNAGMKQKGGEDPMQYADRVMSHLEIYTFFANIMDKVVDTEEAARAWVDGLERGIGKIVSVSLGQLAHYTIKQALEMARDAYGAGPSDDIPPTQLNQMKGSDSPSVPAMDGVLIQQMLDQQAQSLSQMMDRQLGEHMDKIRTPTRHTPPPNLPPQFTKFPCPAPKCAGDRHRYYDCPNKQRCVHCSRPGHHSEACFDRPAKRQADRGRSPTRSTGKDRDRDRSKDRDRKGAGGKPWTPGGGRGSGSGNGNRLNGRGR